MSVDNNPFNTAREINELVQDYDNIPLKKKILQLENEILKLQEENRTLKQQVSNQAEMQPKGKHNYFYKGDIGPYCPTCWQRDRKMVLLPEAENFALGTGRYCRVCDQTFDEGEALSRQRQIKPFF